MARSFLILVALLVTACGGSGAPSGPASNDPVDVDPETAELWGGWATEARTIASVTRQLYNTGSMRPEQASSLRTQAEELAQEIRAAEPASGQVLQLADDLDELAGRLEFGIEYARNSGLPVINIVLPGLPDAYSNLAEHAFSLSETLGVTEPSPTPP